MIRFAGFCGLVLGVSFTWALSLSAEAQAPAATKGAQAPAATKGVQAPAANRAAPAPTASKSGTPVELEAAMKAYAEAFNKHDAAAVGKLWMENGVYVDRETGVRTEGRAAVQKDLEQIFQAQPKIRLNLQGTGVRLIQPTVARVEGTATVVVPDDEPSVVSVTAIYVKSGNTWLLDTVEELPLPQPETAFDALKELDWLVGDWVDESDAVTATSTFRWSPNGAFLVRSFATQSGDDDVMEGTQVIGWDPRSKQIRSWTFNSDGSFGDANWSRNGDDWLIKSSQTLADGGVSSGTYVITKLNDAAMTVRLIGHEVNGEPVPSGDAVKVVRAVAQADVEPAKNVVPAKGVTP